jgi:DNA-binding XRE family transcriptional regulator
MRAPLLRERRLDCGLTQTELATRAGVSRQLVAAVESGRNVPAVDAAMRLAQALATTVEDLFATPVTKATPALGGRLRAGALVRAGRVGDRLIVAELADHGTAGGALANPDGIWVADDLRLFSGASPAGVVIAGCDPAMGVAEGLLEGLGPRSMLAISAPTDQALLALKRARVHAAVVHGRAGELPEPPVPVSRWHLARWQVGLAVASRTPARSFADVLSSGVPIAQRERGAGSQKAFERARIAAGFETVPVGPTATGHLDAARVAAILGGAGVSTEAAAHAFDARFLPLEDHVVEVWLAERWREHPGAVALLGLLAEASFVERVSHFRGYDLTGCGTRLVEA